MVTAVTMPASGMLPDGRGAVSPPFHGGRPTPPSLHRFIYKSYYHSSIVIPHQTVSNWSYYESMENPGRARGPVKTLVIGADHCGQRIDNYLLGQLKAAPRSLVYRLLRTGQVRVNGGRAKPAYRLQQGDSVRLPPVEQPPPGTAPRFTAAQRHMLDASVLFEDAHLMALDKPAGLPVHGGSGLKAGLVELLKAARTDLPYIELAHRIDRHTSGCLLLAKDRPTLLALHDQFRDGRVEKRYLALVKGRWTGKDRVVSGGLSGARLASGERRIRVDAEGKASSTRFIPQRVYHDASLVEAQPLTGRTHQIRVHAAHIGHPLAGDDKYGDRDFNREMRRRGLRRLFLHAHALSFQDPATGRRIDLHAPLPGPLQDLVPP